MSPRLHPPCPRTGRPMRLVPWLVTTASPLAAHRYTVRSNAATSNLSVRAFSSTVRTVASGKGSRNWA